MEKKFKKGEVIWAKVRGFPWWPGVIKSLGTKTTKEQNEEGEIEEVKETKICIVNFIGDNSHSELPLSKIEKFEDKYKEFSKTKKKSLVSSINIAKSIIKGDTTYENHLNCLKRRNSKLKKEKEKEEEDDEEDLIKKDLIQSDRNDREVWRFLGKIYNLFRLKTWKF